MSLAEIISQAVKVTTREGLKTSMWCPFALLYSELATRGEIKPLSDLDLETKEKYWKETEGINQVSFESRRPIKRIWVSQALYMWDLLFLVNQGEENKGDTSPCFKRK